MNKTSFSLNLDLFYCYGVLLDEERLQLGIYFFWHDDVLQKYSRPALNKTGLSFLIG